MNRNIFANKTKHAKFIEDTQKSHALMSDTIKNALNKTNEKLKHFRLVTSTDQSMPNNFQEYNIRDYLIPIDMMNVKPEPIVQLASGRFVGKFNSNTPACKFLTDKNTGYFKRKIKKPRYKKAINSKAYTWNAFYKPRDDKFNSCDSKPNIYDSKLSSNRRINQNLRLAIDSMNQGDFNKQKNAKARSTNVSPSSNRTSLVFKNLSPKGSHLNSSSHRVKLIKYDDSLGKRFYFQKYKIENSLSDKHKSFCFNDK